MSTHVYTVYKITNIINCKYYIGVHKTKTIDDSYMGSGIAIKKAIKRYGISNFKKEILYVYENKQDAYNKEKEILDEIWNSSVTYNMAAGGKGSFDHINLYERKNPMHDPKNVEKMMDTKKRNGSYKTEKMLCSSKNNLKKAVAAWKGSVHTEKAKNKIQISSKSIWENKRDSMLKSMRGVRYRYTLKSPDDNIIELDYGELNEWCNNNGYAVASISVQPVGNRIKRGKLKGWIVLEKERRLFESV